MFQTLSRFGLFQLSNRGWQTGGEYHHTGKHSKVQNELRAAGNVRFCKTRICCNFTFLSVQFSVFFCVSAVLVVC